MSFEFISNLCCVNGSFQSEGVRTASVRWPLPAPIVRVVAAQYLYPWWSDATGVPRMHFFVTGGVPARVISLVDLRVKEEDETGGGPADKWGGRSEPLHFYFVHVRWRVRWYDLISFVEDKSSWLLPLGVAVSFRVNTTSRRCSLTSHQWLVRETVPPKPSTRASFPQAVIHMRYISYYYGGT